MKKYLSTFLAFIMILSTMLAMPAFGAEAENSTELQFNKDGKFKILILSDCQDTDEPQKETIDMINSALDKTQPDLVVFLGDNIAGWWQGVDKEKTVKAIHNIIDPVDERGIPFAIVYGNHDHEGLCDENNQMTEEDAKELMMQVYQEYDTCLAVEGEELTGYGNYNLLIKNSTGDKNVFNLWFMDSNPYAEEGGYGYVQPDQTEYYIRKSNELKAENGGKPMPSLLFQHIIVPEIYDLLEAHDSKVDGAVKGNSVYGDKYYTAGDKILQGELLEGPCPADTRHSQFESWKQQGDIIGAFFGHDHNNTFSYELDGIRLTAVPETGYYSYGFNHGVRTVTLDENDLTAFESDIILSDELLDYEVTPTIKAKHGYYEYDRALKYITVGLVVGAVILVIAAVIAIRVIKKNKAKIKKLENE